MSDFIRHMEGEGLIDNEPRPDTPVDRRQALIKRYCTLQSLVVGPVFEHAHSGDCFCWQGGLSDAWMNRHWRTDDAVIEFIEDAVISAVAFKIGKSKADVRAMLAQRRAD